ncbi:MAG: Fe(3+) ions import ATP-binding protein FbpC [Clostridiales bacterium]|jgi:iron(III) transport system ATP-binding protein|nr:Fe(3+) ions import ATP-binding protein FbpC [Clostridiales bacterium]
MENNNIRKLSINEFSSRSSSVVMKNILKVFPSHDGGGEFTAVNNINLEIADGELVTLLGPSGCGKTTTLRMIAGFEFPTSGEILIGDNPVADVPPNKRDISMVFQSYALFPHLNIYENIAYGLKLKKLSKHEIKERTYKVIDLMQLRGMETRFPAQVSGGQQQRIALARAIVIEPRVLLFDEPLSNLDAKLREHMRDELRKLQKRLGITSLYVTHDQSEAMAISDRVVIMESGNIIQAGTPKEIYEQPNSRFVANFMGKANFIEAIVVENNEEGTVIKVDETPVIIPKPGNTHFKRGEKAYMSLRPESIKLTREGGTFRGVVERATYYGSKVEYEIKVAESYIIIENYNPQITGIFNEGEDVGISLDVQCIRLLA